jgi:hypothetical protein
MIWLDTNLSNEAARTVRRDRLPRCRRRSREAALTIRARRSDQFQAGPLPHWEWRGPR